MPRNPEPDRHSGALRRSRAYALPAFESRVGDTYVVKTRLSMERAASAAPSAFRGVPRNQEQGRPGAYETWTGMPIMGHRSSSLVTE